MRLPESVRQCIRALEDAGFEAYAVGGCVRDSLLGLAPQDFDLCTSAQPQQTCQVFRDYPQELSGIRLGTVKVTLADAEVEITTFRSEGAYSDNRHPDRVDFVSDLETDLARRDFTVNAMAWCPDRGCIDPFGGRQDLAGGILRTVGDPERRFREDGLRILRGMRFAARFRLDVERETLAAMEDLAELTDLLPRERVYEELCGFLLAAEGGDLVRFSFLLTRLLPELAPAVGFLQHSPHHAYDVFTHTAYVTQAVPRQLSLRWAALLHDTGKVATFTLDDTGRGHFYGHAQESARLAESALLRLRAPGALRQQVVWLVDHHMTRLTPEKKLLRRWLSRYGREAVTALLELQEADMASKGIAREWDPAPFARIRQLLEELEQEEGILTVKALAIDGNSLLRLGFSGRAVGTGLNTLLELVLEGTVPNEKTALLEAAERLDENGSNRG